MLRTLTFCSIAFLLIVLCRQPQVDADPGFDMEKFREESMLKMKQPKAVMADMGKGCAYQCKNGAVPTPKKHYKPKYNGCGIPGNFQGMKYDDADFRFEPCCNEHDVCYGQCNKPKSKCDKDFTSCMQNWCKRTYENIDDELFQNCTKRQQMITTSTKLFACGMFQEAQEDACECNKENVAGSIEPANNDEL